MASWPIENGISASPAISSTGAVAWEASASKTPHWNRVVEIGSASTTYPTEIGASTAAAIRAPLEMSSTRSWCRRSAAAALIRGISAMMIETPTIPCAIMSSRKTWLKISRPASVRALLTSVITTSTLTWLAPT